MQTSNRQAPQISPLSQVVTVSEAATMFCYSRDTILYHIEENHLVFRKCKGKRGNYLIELYSLIRQFGEPKVAIDSSNRNT